MGLRNENERKIGPNWRRRSLSIFCRADSQCRESVNRITSEPPPVVGRNKTDSAGNLGQIAKESNAMPAHDARNGPINQGLPGLVLLRPVVTRHVSGECLLQNFLFRVFGPKLAFPLGHYRRGDAVANHIGRRARHVEEVINPEQQQQSCLRDIELGQGRRNHHQ